MQIDRNHHMNMTTGLPEKRDYKYYLAVIVSFLFHPMLMPVYGIFFIFNSGTHLAFIPFEFRRSVYAIVFACSCLLPLTLLMLFKQLNLIQDFRLEHNRERILPVFFTGLFFLAGYLLLKKLQLPSFLYQFVVASMIAIFISLIITFRWKISLHMVGVGGVLGAILALSIKMGIGLSTALIGMIWIAAFTGSARLYLNAHTPGQVLGGFLLGLVAVSVIPFL